MTLTKNKTAIRLESFGLICIVAIGLKGHQKVGGEGDKLTLFMQFSGFHLLNCFVAKDPGCLSKFTLHSLFLMIVASILYDASVHLVRGR